MKLPHLSHDSRSLTRKRLCCWFVGLVLCGLANGARASTISFSGIITQSTPDGTGPAVNNPSLNNIQDLQAYTVSLIFPAFVGLVVILIVKPGPTVPLKVGVAANAGMATSKADAAVSAARAVVFNGSPLRGWTSSSLYARIVPAT